MGRTLVLAIGAALLAIGCGSGNQPAPDTSGGQKVGKKEGDAGPSAPNFATVSATFQANCVGCHGANNPKAGINLTSYETIMKGGTEGPIVVAGDPAASMLVKALKGEGAKQMPPKKDPLPSDQIQQIENWIKDGAKQS